MKKMMMFGLVTVLRFAVSLAATTEFFVKDTVKPDRAMIVGAAFSESKESK